MTSFQVSAQGAAGEVGAKLDVNNDLKDAVLRVAQELGDGPVYVAIDSFEGEAGQGGATPDFIPGHIAVTVSRTDPAADDQNAAAAAAARERVLEMARSSGRLAAEAEIEEARKVIEEARVKEAEAQPPPVEAPPAVEEAEERQPQ
jgi:hypothetical protein